MRISVHSQLFDGATVCRHIRASDLGLQSMMMMMMILMVEFPYGNFLSYRTYLTLMLSFSPEVTYYYSRFTSFGGSALFLFLMVYAGLEKVIDGLQAWGFGKTFLQSWHVFVSVFWLPSSQFCAIFSVFYVQITFFYCAQNTVYRVLLCFLTSNDEYWTSNSLCKKEQMAVVQ